MALLTYNIADFQDLHREWALAGKPHGGILLALDRLYQRDPGGLASDVRATLSHYGELYGANPPDVGWIRDQVFWVMRGSRQQ